MKRTHLIEVHKLITEQMPRETRMTIDQLAAAAMEDEAASAQAGGRQLVMASRQTPSWQETFRQLHDFHKLGNAKSLPPRLVKWMDAQRRRYKLYGVGRKKSVGIIKYRIAQLNSIEFDWFQGEEKRPDCDPRPTVILPPSQRPTQPSSTSQRINSEQQVVEAYSPSSTHRHNNKRKKPAHTPRSLPAGGNIEIPMHSMDRKQLLNAGFPEQLFHMVNGGAEKCPHIIDWVADGSAFEIFDTKNVGNFIRQYFRHSNLSSLRRMLHLYLFTTSNNVFHHPHFHRDSSLADLKRNVVISQKNDSNSKKEDILVNDKKTPGHDASEGGNIEEIFTPHIDRKVLLNTGFPEQLFHLVNDGAAKCPHIIDWLPDGSAFEILDTKNIGNFIRHYFRHGKLSSLRRMLHLYLFTTSNNVFRHPHFHRDRDLAHIKTYVVKK